MGRVCETCPAAELTHGTLSQNKLDVRCHVAGLLRDAEDSPCIADYTNCKIWRMEKERMWKNRKQKEKKMVHAGGMS